MLVLKLSSTPRILRQATVMSPVAAAPEIGCRIFWRSGLFDSDHLPLHLGEFSGLSVCRHRQRTRLARR
jgi:hypothetical protein